MSVNARRLNTNDVLIYDEIKHEAFLIRHEASPEKLFSEPSDQHLLKMARHLVMAGHGIHLTSSQMNTLGKATGHIEFLS